MPILKDAGRSREIEWPKHRPIAEAAGARIPDAVGSRRCELGADRARRIERLVVGWFAACCAAHLIGSAAVAGAIGSGPQQDADHSAAQVIKKEVLKKLSAIKGEQPRPQDRAAADGGRPPSDEDDPLHQDGLLQKIAPALSKWMNMGWNGNRLELPINDSYEGLQTYTNAVRNIAGYGGGTSHSGNGEFHAALTSQKLIGHASRTKQGNRFETELFLEESESPSRAFSVRIDDQNNIAIEVHAIESAYVLRFRQAADGEIILQELRGQVPFAKRARNLDALMRENADFAERRLLPMFENFGLGRLTSPYSREIQDQIVAFMSPWPTAELKRAQELVQDLDAADYQKREAATQAIVDSFQANESMLTRVALDRQFTPEVRARLRQVINQQSETDAKKKLDFLNRMMARDNTEYFLWLMEAQSDPQTQRMLLEKVGQLIDVPLHEINDLRAMIDRRGLQPSATGERIAAQPPSLADQLQEDGALQTVASYTAQLIRLDWNEDQLAVDREHWKKPFGGREISDLIEEVEQKLKDNNLPGSWFNAGGGKHTPQSAQHPQVLFELLSQNTQGKAVGMRHRSSYSRFASGATPNRQFANDTLAGELLFDKWSVRSVSSAAANLSDKPFTFSLREVAGPRRKVVVSQLKPDQFLLRVTGEESDLMLQLVLRATSASVQYVRGDHAVGFQAATFRQLQAEHEPFFRDQFFPLLRHLGLEIAEAVCAAPADEPVRAND